jgi:Tol biopolymer transport system component
MNWATISMIVVTSVVINCGTVNAGRIASSAGAIAFISQRDGGVQHIFLRNPAGTAITQLTSGPYPDNSFSWSPDGTKLAFWRSEDGEAIYTMSVGGSNLKRLSPSAGRDIFPSWSPDGTKLVFCHVIDPGSGPPNQIIDIMMMDAGGTNVQTVLANNAFNMEPRWSPDGSKILFVSTLGNDGVQIYTMTPTGTNITDLTNAPWTINGDPAWSPDGSKISFASNRVTGKINIFIMNSDGSEVQQTTNFAEPAEAEDPGWSPDGTKISFEYVGDDYQSNPNTNAQVWVMNPDGSDQENTGQQCANFACSPRWQP